MCRARGQALLILVVSMSLLALGIATAASSAATPKAGCWGTCGGPAGPLNGVFVVKGTQVTNFEYSESCLGTTKYGTDYLHILKPLTINPMGAFAYKGSAIVSDLSSPKSLYPTPVTLTGTFKTPASATVTIATSHTGCPTKRLPMHFAG
jgi:hypothetical protein